MAVSATAQQRFEPALRDRCVLLPSVIGDESVKEAEDLLSPQVRKALTEAIYGSTGRKTPRPKKALSQAVLELYARQEEVAVDKATRERLEDLLKKLAANLAAQAKA